ncbi:MAG: beta-lactamase family protein, partial [Planctomycetaceae bacterium]|nr:beta-lactamase family protein [Planctomycetaceae bacterium]
GGVAVGANDLWHLGSCTKAMTATLAARLVEQGKIRWDTSVESVFPQWKDKLHDDWRATTLEQLLANRGGAPGSAPRELWIALGSREGTPQETRTWFVGELLAREPEAKAGTKFIYSNQGFTIAGAMLEAATGKSWEDLMRVELFAPLGMTSAGFGAPGSADEVDQPRGHTKKPVKPGPRADNPAAIGPAGTVHASLADWAKFANAHLEGARGEGQFLKPESWKKLHTAPAAQDYALGWGTAERSWAGGRTLSHSGSNTMWFCTLWLAPEKGEAYLVTTNTGAEVAAKACDEAVGALIAARRK